MIIRLLQWNIWYKEKITNIVKTLKQLNPDIICMQELTIIMDPDGQVVDNVKTVYENLEMPYYFEIAQNLLAEK